MSPPHPNELITREVLERSMREIVGRRDWDALVELVGDLGCEDRRGYVSYGKLPKPMEYKIRCHMGVHRRCRLSKCLVREAEVLTFKPQG